ncbi:probable G-protein coupled receptor 85 [Gigantopelta aegis]|uniref:probable G-protein coupled receptor 85 n=1 Tax=Gigantopelta aegis TaxID=1735272 RepID=UPI001B88AA6C|nr:probable G-protein coupled receptor 85 [Gigantopelta aegis]
MKAASPRYLMVLHSLIAIRNPASAAVSTSLDRAPFRKRRYSAMVDYMSQLILSSLRGHGGSPGVKQEAPLAISGVKQDAPLAINGVKRDAPLAISGVKRDAPLAISGVKQDAPLAISGVKQDAPLAINGVKQDAPLAISGVKRDAPLAISGVKQDAPLAISGMEVNVTENLSITTDVWYNITSVSNNDLVQSETSTYRGGADDMSSRNHETTVEALENLTSTYDITSEYNSSRSAIISTLLSQTYEDTSAVDVFTSAVDAFTSAPASPETQTVSYENDTASWSSDIDYSSSSYTHRYDYPLLTSTWSDFVTSVSQSETVDKSETAEPDVEIVVLKVLSLVLIAVAAVAGNGFILVRVVKASNLHRPPFYYLLSMCVSDISRSVFCVPLVLTSVLQNSVWKYGSSACKLFAFANSFFIYSSCMSVLAIAVDRHVSIVYSKYYRRRSRGLLNMIVVVIGWTVAFTMSFPPVIGVGTYVFIPDEAQCTFYHRDYRRNDTLGFLLVFTLILFFAGFLYFRVFAFLRAHRRMRPLEHTAARSRNWTFIGPGANGQAVVNWLNGFGGHNQPNPIPNPVRNPQIHPNFGRVVNLQVTRNEHLTRLFCILTCAFGTLWAPYVVLGFWRIFGDENLITSPYVTISTWLSYTQVALCPVVYILARGPIRRSSRTVLDSNNKKEFLLEPRHRK